MTILLVRAAGFSPLQQMHLLLIENRQSAQGQSHETETLLATTSADQTV